MVSKYYVRKDSTNYDITSFEIKQEGSSAIDETTFSVSRDHDSIFSIGDDVSIGYVSGSFVTVFAGDIVRKEISEELVCTMESYGGRLNRIMVSELYESQSPEDIAQDLVDNNSSLTYASTAASGVTITKFVVRDETIADALKRLTGLLDWQIRTDNDKNFYFEPSGNTNSNVVLTVGSNCRLSSNWKENPNKLVNSVTFIGGKARFTTLDNFTSGDGQTEFSLSYKPVGNVRVLVDAVEKVGGQDGSVASYDYTVDDENKKIIFEAGVALNADVDVYYEYEIPIKIIAKDEDSIAAYTEFTKKITNNNIKTMADARKLVSKILTTYSSPAKNGVLLTNYDTDVNVGESVNVIDSFNSVNDWFVVNKLTLTYPGGDKEIELGTPELSLLDWNQEVDARIKALEQKQDSGDVVQKYVSFKEDVLVSQKMGRVRVRTDTLGHSFILGSAGNGVLGVNTGTEDGEQQVLGEAGRVETVVRVVNPGLTMIERFEFTTFKDASNTTADWDTSNSRLAMSSSGDHMVAYNTVATSLSVFLNVEDVVSVTLTADETVYGSDQILYYLSANGGGAWEEVTNGTAHTFVNSDNDLRFKVVFIGNGGADTYIENLQVVYVV